MKRIIATLLVSTLPFLTATGCGGAGKDDEKEDDAGSEGAPPPPPVGTISLDLDVSDGTQKLGFAEVGGLAAASVATLGLNHAAASIVVLVVNVNISLSLVIPVGLLKAAAASTPKLTAPNTYTYSFEFTTQNRAWTGNFIAVVGEADARAYSMRVTSEPKDANGCCTDFEFFNGSAVAGQSTGAWQVFDPTKPTAAAKLFGISYDFKSETDKTLTFLVNSDKPATEKFGSGSRVAYKVAGNDVTMTVRDSAENADRVIAWSKASGAGSHLDPQGKKTCWDTKDKNRVDVACP